MSQKGTEQISEAEISMVLNTFMYLDYKEAAEGTTLGQIITDLADHPDYGGGGLYYGEYTVLKQAVEAEAIGSLEIGYQSVNMGYDTGTAACVFAAPKKDTVYVVYRGTGDGEWPDNGLGMTECVTTQQERALNYFEEVVEDMGIGKEQRLIVTGHSKGGNKAQFVTMKTQYEELLDVCYSVDGQGFSENAIKSWKKEYGQQEYDRRCGKLHGIYGENDYVSVLGNSIVPKEQIRYVSTPVEKGNFAGYHDIKYMFAALEQNEATGESVTIFHGRKNGDSSGQGKLGEYAGSLSAQLMVLDAEKRDGCAAVVMQLMESTRGSRKGLNGEKVTLSDVCDFLLYGIPVIADSLLGQETGRSFLQAFFHAASFGNQLPSNINLQVDMELLLQKAKAQREAAAVLHLQIEELRRQAERIPGYLKTGTVLYHRLKLSAGRLEKLEENLRLIADMKEEIVGMYQKWNRQMTESVGLIFQ